MRRSLINIFYFFKSKSFLKYLIVSLILVAILVGFWFILYYAFDQKDELISYVPAAIFGFAVSNLAIYIFDAIVHSREDALKINTDTKSLLKTYDGDRTYRKVITLNNTETVVVYHDVFVNDGDNKFKVVDDMNKNFELDDLFCEHYQDLFETHASSSVENCLTIRLDDFRKEEGVYKFYLSRSTFYNHLVTNRALDYEISHKLSMRSVYEPGPYINPLSLSKLSNHIGINALVYLNDGHLLIPQRKGNSTISKKMITSSIATRLMFSGKVNEEITTDYLLRKNIYDNLFKRLNFDLFKEELNQDNVDIKFLGFGQNIYEGGKPQFYYKVVLNKVGLSNYESCLAVTAFNVGKIDNDKKVFVAKKGSLHFVKKSSMVAFDAYHFETKKYKEIKRKTEKSMLCNFYHESIDDRKNIIILDCFGTFADSMFKPWFIKKYGEEKGLELADKFAKEGAIGHYSIDDIAFVLTGNKKEKNKLLKEWGDLLKVDHKYIDYIRELKKDNIIVIASNAPKGLVEMVMKKYHIENLFDEVFISYQLKCLKPTKEFYQNIYKCFPRRFEKVIVIDDTPRILSGIEDKSIIKLQYKGLEPLKAELNSIIKII